MFGESWLVLRMIPKISEVHWKYSWFSRQNWLICWHKDFNTFFLWNNSKILRGIWQGPSLGGFDPALNHFQRQWTAEAFWWVIAKVLRILEFSPVADATGDCENLTKVCNGGIFLCVFNVVRMRKAPVSYKKQFFAVSKSLLVEAPYLNVLCQPIGCPQSTESNQTVKE